MIIKMNAMTAWRRSDRHAILISGFFIYLGMLDKVFGTEYNFIKEKHCCLEKSRDTLDKAENIPIHMKERMKHELMMMHQKPFFR